MNAFGPQSLSACLQRNHERLPCQNSYNTKVTKEHKGESSLPRPLPDISLSSPSPQHGLSRMGNRLKSAIQVKVIQLNVEARDFSLNALRGLAQIVRMTLGVALRPIRPAILVID